MKELSIEGKATRYDEAIKVAQRFYNNSVAITKKGLEDIFPELKDSEDSEDVLSALKREIKWLEVEAKWDNIGGISFDKVYAWLEKQGEQKPYGQRQECVDCQFNYAGECKGFCAMKRGEQNPVAPKFRVGDIITPKGKKEYYTVIDIVDGWYEFREKHVNGGIPIHYQFGWELVKQKPAWSEEDEKIIETMCKEGDLKPSEMQWLKSLKDRVQPQQEWSEEDKNKVTLFMQLTEGCDNEEELADWLKSLKDRVQPQPQQEWTIHDEEELRIALNTLREAGQNDSAHWLKNVCLIPQNKWKPSDEQIEALESATENCAYSEYQDCLRELIVELKKLRKE